MKRSPAFTNVCLLLLLHVVNASSQDNRCNIQQEDALLDDEVSFLQLSATATEDSSRQEEADSHHHASDQALRRARLQRRISRARARLAKMEAELAELDSTARAF